MVDLSLVDWSRAQFALTAIYHWLFVPLTLGITYIIAIMETIYYRTRKRFWEKLTKFWLRVFAVNFAIWVATWIILEFEFGTNWSNYSWFVWDIFWAPLMLEGISAFILEATFLAVLLLGWWKVSKKFHLLSAWLVAIWSSTSALWILIANAWMQHPVGMVFNPDTMRNEMNNFWEVVFNPTAIAKISHTLAQWFTLASVVVIWISCYFLLKNREKKFAYASIKIASIFWMFWIIITVIAGDMSWKEVANYQPMKLAAIEAHYEWAVWAKYNVFSVFWEEDKDWKNKILWNISIPYGLSLIINKDINSYVPWINDLLYWNEKYHIRWAIDRIEPGKLAIDSLKKYKIAKKNWDNIEAKKQLAIFREHEKDFWYGYFDKNKLWELVPNIPLLFYSFRYMVIMGFFMMLIYFPLMIYLSRKETLHKHKKLLILALFMIPLVYIASELWWVVAEVWRQPWVVYEILPTKIWISATNVTIVKSTFFWFLFIFTILLIAALKIAVNEIQKGPKIDK